MHNRRVKFRGLDAPEPDKIDRTIRAALATGLFHYAEMATSRQQALLSRAFFAANMAGTATSSGS